MRRPTFLLTLPLVGALAAGLVAGAAGSAEAAVDRPIITGAANPGVLKTLVGDTQKWVMMTTSSPTAKGTIRSATSATGPWKRHSGHGLLTRVPGWMAKQAVWAPSLIQATDGKYHAYYSGIVRGSKTERCLGTGVSDTATGPYKPAIRPLVCFSGSGTDPKETLPREGPKAFTLIDPTPAIIDGQYLLTFKTGYHRSNAWHTTTRMLSLDPAYPSRPVANPVHADGRSVKLADSVDKYIEENPVMVKHGSRYTLATSFGWYGTCNYWTRYRQNDDLWTGWLKKSPARLPFASGIHTCGTGNGQLTSNATGSTWRLWFNGHPDYPASTNGGPDGLYVGAVRWHHGKPRVVRLLE